MNKRVRLVGKLVLVCVAAVLLLFTYALNHHTALPVNPDWAVPGEPAVSAGAVTVRYSGTATLLFSDGETTWMTDGWFSRPSPLQLVLGKIEPDLSAIEWGLAANGVDTLAAVVPLHSHYDHAMDAPEVARRTGAVLMGSDTTAYIGRGWGLPESQIQVLVDREPFHLGRFEITPIESRHFQFPDPMVRERGLGSPSLESPLVPPVAAFDYPVGKAYLLHVSHPAGSWLIVGSAGYVPDALRGLEAETVFLGVGGLGSQSPAYREGYWREMIEAVAASRVVPIHYDSLTGPLQGPFLGPVTAVTWVSGDEEETRAFLYDKAAANPEIQFMTLPRFEPVSLFP